MNKSHRKVSTSSTPSHSPRIGPSSCSSSCNPCICTCWDSARESSCSWWRGEWPCHPVGVHCRSLSSIQLAGSRSTSSTLTLTLPSLPTFTIALKKSSHGWTLSWSKPVRWNSKSLQLSKTKRNNSCCHRSTKFDLSSASWSMTWSFSETLAYTTACWRLKNLKVHSLYTSNSHPTSVTATPITS